MHALPPLDVSHAVTAWHLDLLPVLAALLGAIVYLNLVRRARRQGQRWPSGRLVAFYTSTGRTWGLSPLQDQNWAGNILWVVAEVVDLPFLALLVLQWIRADARQAAETDAMLDAQLAVAREAGEAADGEDRVRPWWETEGAFGDHWAARFRR